MATIPLPALDVKTPQQPNALAVLAQLQQYKAGQQEQQVRAQQLEQMKESVRQTKVLNDAVKQFTDQSGNTNHDAVLNYMAQNGAGKDLIDYRTKLATFNKEQLASEEQRLKTIKTRFDAAARMVSTVNDPQSWETARQHVAKEISPDLAQQMGDFSPQQKEIVMQFGQNASEHAAYMKDLAGKARDDAEAGAAGARQKETTASTTEKQLATIGQVLGNAANPMEWAGRRAFLAAKGIAAEDLDALGIPVKYSPEAAQAAKALGVSPEKQAGLPDVQQYIQNYLKSNNLADTPTNRLKAHGAYIKETKVVPQVSVINATNPLTGAPAGGSVPGIGEDSLKGMNPNQQALVRGVADYTIDPTQYRSNRNPNVEADLVAAAKRYNPSYDQTAYAEKSRLRADLGKQSQALNAATHHLDLASEAIDGLNNTSLPIWNKIANTWHVQTGGDSVARFEAVKAAVAGELSKIFKGGQATDHEIATQNQNLQAAGSPKALKAAVNQYIRLMQGRLEGLEETYEGQIGIKPNFKIVSPRTQQIFDKANPGSQAPTNKDAGQIVVVDPHGGKHYFKDQASADKFKKLANIQ